MNNDYEIRGDHAVVFLNRKDGALLETLIDIKYLQIVNDHPYKWNAKWDETIKSFYCQSSIYRNGKRTKISLHRFLMGDPSGYVIDHINHDTLDNRECNLRIVTNAENIQNRKGAYRNSRSGVRGVFWYKATQKWSAQVKINNKQIHLGYYNTIEEAEEVVKEFRAKHMPFSQDALENELNNETIA